MRAQFSYTGGSEGYLPLIEGMEVEVLEEDDSGYLLYLVYLI